MFRFVAEEAQKALEESMAMDMDDRQELAHELYRARHAGPSVGSCSVSTLGRRNTLGRKAASVHPGPPPPMMGKSPPRPSPASVAYHSDEESLKGYDENPDDSSVTEKPSEISSTDSQVKNKISARLFFQRIFHRFRRVKFIKKFKTHVKNLKFENIIAFTVAVVRILFSQQ